MGATPPDDPPDHLFRTAWLAARLREGEAQQFQELYERVAPALFTWARLRLEPPLWSCLDPQDLVQEVWFRALRRFESYSPASGSFRAWVFGIAKTTLIEAFRKLGPVRRLDPRQGSAIRSSELAQVPESVTSICSRLATDESIRRFVAFAERISPEDRQILMLCGLEGTPCREAARLVGLGYEAVASRWKRLRATLR